VAQRVHAAAGTCITDEHKARGRQRAGATQEFLLKKEFWGNAKALRGLLPFISLDLKLPLLGTPGQSF